MSESSPFRSLRRALRPWSPFRRRVVVPAVTHPSIDMGWFAEVEHRVGLELRAASLAMRNELEPLLRTPHRGVRVSVDVERGSMLLDFADGDCWRFAVSDVAAAEQLAAASRLGGLLLRLSTTENGEVHVHGLWGRFSYALVGVPVRDVFLR